MCCMLSIRVFCVGLAREAGGNGGSLTAGQVGLDVHSVSEATRIELDRQLQAFRDDEVCGLES